MLVAYTDGCCLGNPGDMGIGVAIYKENACIEKYAKYLGKGTNNIAEYTAVIHALTLAKQCGENHVLIRSDSLLMVKQMKGEYKIKEPHLMELRRKIIETMHGMRVEFEHVPREKNTVADLLSKQAAQEKCDIHEHI